MITYTIALSILMMTGLFLMLWSAVGFIQDKRFFTSAPKAAQEVIQPKEDFDCEVGDHHCRQSRDCGRFIRCYDYFLR